MKQTKWWKEEKSRNKIINEMANQHADMLADLPNPEQFSLLIGVKQVLIWKKMDHKEVKALLNKACELYYENMVVIQAIETHIEKKNNLESLLYEVQTGKNIASKFSEFGNRLIELTQILDKLGISTETEVETFLPALRVFIPANLLDTETEELFDTTKGSNLDLDKVESLARRAIDKAIACLPSILLEEDIDIDKELDKLD